MTYHITADRLVESAIKAVTKELFRDFDNTLRTLCEEDDNRKAVFRTLCYARTDIKYRKGESRTCFLNKLRTPEPADVMRR